MLVPLRELAAALEILDNLPPVTDGKYWIMHPGAIQRSLHQEEVVQVVFCQQNGNVVQHSRKIIGGSDGCATTVYGSTQTPAKQMTFCQARVSFRGGTWAL